MVCDCLSDNAHSESRGVSDRFNPAPCYSRVPDRVCLQHRALWRRSTAHQGSERPVEKAVGGSASPRRSLRRGRGGLRCQDNDQPRLANHREPSIQSLARNQLGPTSSTHNLPRSIQHRSPDPPHRASLSRNQRTKTTRQTRITSHTGRVRTRRPPTLHLVRRPLPPTTLPNRLSFSLCGCAHSCCISCSKIILAGERRTTQRRRAHLPTLGTRSHDRILPNWRRANSTRGFDNAISPVASHCGVVRSVCRSYGLVPGETRRPI